MAYLKPSGRAYHCGLRVADVIVSINGLPATSHEQSIRIIEEATQCSRDVVCSLLSRDPPPSGEAEAMSIRLLGRVSHRDQEGVTYYSMTVLDGTSAVHVELGFLLTRATMSLHSEAVAAESASARMIFMMCK